MLATRKSVQSQPEQWSKKNGQKNGAIGLDFHECERETAAMASIIKKKSFSLACAAELS